MLLVVTLNGTADPDSPVEALKQSDKITLWNDFVSSCYSGASFRMAGTDINNINGSFAQVSALKNRLKLRSSTIDLLSGDSIMSWEPITSLNDWASNVSPVQDFVAPTRHCCTERRKTQLHCITPGRLLRVRQQQIRNKTLIISVEFDLPSRNLHTLNFTLAGHTSCSTLPCTADRPGLMKLMRDCGVIES